MKSLALSVAGCVLALITSHAQPSTGLSAAVDAKGIRHRGSDYPGRAPWIDDVVHMVKPVYPFSERARHHTGSGLLRLTLDLKTGSVSRVALIKSTGFPLLDNSAVTACRQWRWKPGKWKETDMPIAFTMTMKSLPLTSRGTQPLAVAFEFTVGPDGSRQNIHVSRMEVLATHQEVKNALTEREKQVGINLIAQRERLSPKEAGQKLCDIEFFDTVTHTYLGH